MKYDMERNICYWLAQHLGIASHIMYGTRNGKRKRVECTFVIPQKIFEYDREHDDDRWYIYEKVGGIQLFPLDRNWLKYKEIEFGWDSLYRSYIRERVEGK